MEQAIADRVNDWSRHQYSRALYVFYQTIASPIYEGYQINFDSRGSHEFYQIN
jgi:hypothetical protein